MKAVFDYMDTFTSRIKEMEQKKEKGLTCKKEDKSRTLENFLSRLVMNYAFSPHYLDFVLSPLCVRVMKQKHTTEIP